MIIRKLQEIANNSLYDAILLAESRSFPFKSIYIDPNGECAITFKGHIPERIIQEFFFDINPNINCDSTIDNEEVIYNVDFTYYNSTTEIYTREGWKY